MFATYLPWVIVFFIGPTALLWIVFFAHLKSYRGVFIRIMICSMVAGMLWDLFAVVTHIWTWPGVCCVLPRIATIPLEELFFMAFGSLYIASLAIILRDVTTKHRRNNH